MGLRAVTDRLSLRFAGETKQPCVLTLVDDSLHEDTEELRLVLGSPRGDSPFGAAVGERNETLIRIRDAADGKKLFLVLGLELGTEILPGDRCRGLRKQPPLLNKKKTK